MKLRSAAFTLARGVSLAIMITACSGSKEMPAETAPSEGKDVPVETMFEDNQPTVTRQPSMSERLVPECITDRVATKFPKSSEGAAFRAIVNLVIGPDGLAQDICYRRVEGPLDMEEKAMGDRLSWKFDKKFAGQKREKLIIYRTRPGGKGN